MDKKELLEKLRILLKAIGEEPPVLRELPPCNIYTIDDYERFLNDEMAHEEEIELVNHCDSCVACQKGLLQCEKQIEAEEKKQCEEMLKKTFALLREPQDIISKNLVDIVLTVSRKIIDIVKTTGKVISSPQPVLLRGDVQRIEERRKLEIIQRFTNPPVSLQISFEILEEKDKEQALIVTLSTFDEESEEFQNGVEVSLSGEDYSARALTDSDGKALFVVRYPGVYDMSLRLPEDGEIAVRIEIMQA